MCLFAIAVLKQINCCEIERICVSTAKKTSPLTPGKSNWDTPGEPSTGQLFTSAASPLCSTLSTRCVSLRVWPGRHVRCVQGPDDRTAFKGRLAKHYKSLDVNGGAFFSPPPPNHHHHLPFFSFIRKRLAWWCSSRAAEGRTPSWTSCQVARERR